MQHQDTLAYSSFHGFNKGSQAIDHNTFHPWDNCREAALAGWFVKSRGSVTRIKPYRIIRDNPGVEEVITALRSTMTPLNAEGTDNA